MVIGFALKAMFKSQGLEVLGPFANSEDALEALKNNPVDMAFLDINLGQGKTSAPVADALFASNTPYAFITGYGSAGVMPDRFSNVTRFVKPAQKQQLLSAIEQALS